VAKQKLRNATSLLLLRPGRQSKPQSKPSAISTFWSIMPECIPEDVPGTDRGSVGQNHQHDLKSTAFFSQAAAQAMIKAGHGGKIINIGSGSSFRPSGKGLAHYCAAKGGVVSLTRAMAKELTPYAYYATRSSRAQ